MIDLLVRRRFHCSELLNTSRLVSSAACVNQLTRTWHGDHLPALRSNGRCGPSSRAHQGRLQVRAPDALHPSRRRREGNVRSRRHRPPRRRQTKPCRRRQGAARFGALKPAPKPTEPTPFAPSGHNFPTNGRSSSAAGSDSASSARKNRTERRTGKTTCRKWREGPWR